MEHVIFENAEKLLSGLMISAGLYFALIVLAVVITIGVIKFKLLKAKWQNIVLATCISVASIILIVVMVLTLLPIYKDYSKQDYVVLEDVKVVVGESTSVGIDRITVVIVCDGEKQIELKMQSEIALDAGEEYTGTIAYLKNSEYLIWYDFE